MNKATAPVIDPKTLGLWIQWVRKAQDLSQENIADASNLSTRTVQRIEAGASSDVGTRRRLATALGYGDPDVFQTAAFAENVTKIFSDLKAAVQLDNEQAIARQFPDHVPLKADRVRTGEQLGRLVQEAMCRDFGYGEDIRAEAKSAAASLIDFLTEFHDDLDMHSETSKLSNYDYMTELVQQIESHGGAVYGANRAVQIIFTDAKDPETIIVAHLGVAPANKPITHLMVKKNPTI